MISLPFHLEEAIQLYQIQYLVDGDLNLIYIFQIGSHEMLHTDLNQIIRPHQFYCLLGYIHEEFVLVEIHYKKLNNPQLDGVRPRYV